MKKVNPFYKSAEWKRIRIQALKRDHYECVVCAREGRVSDAHLLQVDHIQPIDERPDLALDLDNLQTLCPQHHNIKHGRYCGQIKRAPRWTDERWD